MLEPLTQLVIRPKLSPYLGGLLRFVCIYGVYLHLAIFIFGSSTLILTSPISCAVPKDSSFTDAYVNSRCANKPLLKFDETELKEIADETEKYQQELMAKQANGRNVGKKHPEAVFERGNNEETSNMVSYYR